MLHAMTARLIEERRGGAARVDLERLFLQHRRSLLFAQLVAGGSLLEKLRNLAWVVDVLSDRESSWDATELTILAEESAPFLPADALLSAIASLPILEMKGNVYRLADRLSVGEGPPWLVSEHASTSLDEIRELLRVGVSARQTWDRSRLADVLRGVREFGFECLRAWRARQSAERRVSGIPFLWNVAPDGRTSPMGELPASSATIDIVRLVVEPAPLLNVDATTDERSLIEWAFDEIIAKVTVDDQGRGSYRLDEDDSYPSAEHPINDTQARVIHLLVSLSASDADHLDGTRRSIARSTAAQLARYLLGQQLSARGEVHDGFWSFHKYGVPSTDSFQVLTINSELAVKALEAVWPMADAELRNAISNSLADVSSALRRTAAAGEGSVGWQQHFSTLTTGAASTAPLPNHGRDLLATARAVVILATASSLGATGDCRDLVADGLRFVEQVWSPEQITPENDVEFIPYRSPQRDRWSDLTFRITNPISAVMPYYVMKAVRLAELSLPIFLTEPINNAVNFALDSYSGHGFWRDAPSGLAYPTNTAFNMEMLIEYLRAA